MALGRQLAMDVDDNEPVCVELQGRWLRWRAERGSHDAPYNVYKAREATPITTWVTRQLTAAYVSVGGGERSETDERSEEAPGSGPWGSSMARGVP